MWRAEIRILPGSRWFSKKKLKRMGATKYSDGKYIVETEDKKYVSKICEKYRWKYEWYKKEWVRSSGYRSTFFRFNPPPYRCRYCNRKLSKKKLEVDHLIPVGKSKRSHYARFLLKIQGINNVNDVRNLVPSCHRCNERKKDKIGIWLIKGILGKYKIYWMIRNIVIALFLILIIRLIVNIYCFGSI